MPIPISLENCSKGHSLSVKNAKRLIEDAKGLFNQERYASAFYLAMLGIEELGKALLFLDHIEHKKDVTESQWEKRFKKHPVKLRRVEEAISKHVRKLKIFELPPEHAQRLLIDTFVRDKERYAYVDFDFRIGMWKVPWEPYKRKRTIGSIVFGYTNYALKAVKEEEKVKAKA